MSMATGTLTDLKPPVRDTGIAGWLRANLFSSWLNALLTLVGVFLIYKIAYGVISWGIVNAVWTGSADACQQAQGIGACWSAVREKYRFILFGTYTYEEQWRPFLVILLFLTALFVTCFRRFWTPVLVYLWIAIFALMLLLLWGGVFGLTFVSASLWGGLPLTLVLSIVGIVVAFPIGILLALGRRSHMPGVKTLCVVFIEFVRGVPLISVLFMASVMFPLFMPEGVNFDKLLRAQIGIILFAAAYQAEVVRAGLQAIPKGQYEAADALGLGYWQKTWKVILPQALKLVIPPLVNNFISTFKDTSLVTVIGLYDLLNTARTAMLDPQWRAFQAEAYIAAGAIFWLFCFFMSKFSQYLERRLETGHKRH